MPIYNGSIKQGTLYYGGSKIKEAYYGNIKVFSNGPLYYCYKNTSNAYIYFTQKLTTNGTYTMYMTDIFGGQATSSSQLQISTDTGITIVNATTVYVQIFQYNYSYYQSGDLYT